MIYNCSRTVMRLVICSYLTVYLKISRLGGLDERRLIHENARANMQLYVYVISKVLDKAVREYIRLETWHVF